MKKVIITTLLLCTGLITAGCEKTYSVEEFKKDPQLRSEWDAKCGFAGTSKNCENLRLAAVELEKEYEANAKERMRQEQENLDKTFERIKARQKADQERWEAEKKEIERKAKEQSEKQQNSH